MNSKRTLVPAIVLAGLSYMAAGAAAADAESCRIVRIADGGYSDNIAQNGLVVAVLQALDYEADVQLLSVPVMLETLKTAQMDVFLDAWSPAIDPQVEPYLDAGEVTRLKATLTDARYTLAVPAYAYDAGLQDFADIHRFQDELDGKIYGLEAGNDSNLNIAIMIESNDFDLGDFELVESSEQAMLSQLRRSVARDDWMVFPAWSPHPMNVQFDIRYLSGGDTYYGPDYGAASVYTLVRNDYVEDCPNVGRFFENLDFTADMESAVMQAIDEGSDFIDAGRAYLTADPAPLVRWLEGVTTFDGQPGLERVDTAFGIAR